ncbi:MAG: D-aminoacyl-tRNA deacylase [Pseudomonadota bacterium]
MSHLKIVLQRVSSARVSVNSETVGEIQNGLLLLTGFGRSDASVDLDRIVEKVLNLRVFENASGQLDRSVKDIGGSILLVPQFTLLAHTRKGRRPDFTEAMAPSGAEKKFGQLVSKFKQLTDLNIETGQFGTDMSVVLTNEGPFTLLLEY